MSTGTRTDWSNFLKQYSAEQQQVSNWDYLFSHMLEQQYTAGSTGLEQQAQKNIGDAYGNYVASQLQLKNIDGITAGYRDTLNKTLTESYEQSIYDTNQQLLANKASLLTNLGQEIANYKVSAEKNIDEQATALLGYENDLLKHASTMMVEDELLTEKYSNLFKFDAEGNVLGWSDNANKFMYETADPNNPNSLKYSETGKQLMGAVLQDFGDWAKVNYNAEKYSDWVETGYYNLNNAIFGSDLNPYSGDNSIFRTMSDDIRYDKINSEKNALGILDVTSGKNLSTPEALKIFNWNSVGLIEYYSNKGHSDERTAYHYGPEASDERNYKKRLMAASIANVIKSNDFKAGDIIEMNSDWLGYFVNDYALIYAKNTQETREKLAKAGIKIGK